MSDTSVQESPKPCPFCGHNPEWSKTFELVKRVEELEAQLRSALPTPPETEETET